MEYLHWQRSDGVATWTQITASLRKCPVYSGGNSCAIYSILNDCQATDGRLHRVKFARAAGVHPAAGLGRTVVLGTTTATLLRNSPNPSWRDRGLPVALGPQTPTVGPYCLAVSCATPTAFAATGWCMTEFHRVVTLSCRSDASSGLSSTRSGHRRTPTVAPKLTLIISTTGSLDFGMRIDRSLTEARGMA
jgi:hypothetical protein